MKRVSIVVNARLGSSRVSNKLTRPFGSTCLLRRALEKVNQLSFAENRFLAIAEPELEKYVEGLNNIDILWREEEAVKKGDNQHSVTFAHYLKIPTTWIMVINSCTPFVSLETYKKAYDEFQKTDHEAYTSVIRTKAWVFDSDGNPVTNKDPQVLSTKKGGYSYDVAHVFHFVNRDLFSSTGLHWRMKKNSPHLIEIPFEESLDVDTQLEFRINELLLNDGYPDNKAYHDALNVEINSAFQDVTSQPDKTNKEFVVDKYNLSKSDRCFIVAEVGCSHDGSLGIAHRYIEVAAEAGVDAIKFQTHIASAESTIHEPFRTSFSRKDTTRIDYWRRMEFSEEEWRTLKQHAEKLGLVFISSPFSIEAVDLLSRLDVKVWKIGSGEITNLPMLQQIGNTGLPVILSTGMSTWPEIDDAVNLISQYRNPIALLQCTTDYPCPPEKAGLNNIYELRKRYSVPVGFSSHSHETTQCLMAASIGINILEFHITLSKYSYGPDVKASLDPGQTRYMVSQIRDIEIMRKSKTDKEILAADLDSIRKCFYKSIVAKKDIKTGTILNTDLLTAKKPGTGIPPKEINSLVGKRVKKNLAKDEILTYEDLED